VYGERARSGLVLAGSTSQTWYEHRWDVAYQHRARVWAEESDLLSVGDAASWETLWSESLRHGEWVLLDRLDSDLTTLSPIPGKWVADDLSRETFVPARMSAGVPLYSWPVEWWRAEAPPAPPIVEGEGFIYAMTYLSGGASAQSAFVDGADVSMPAGNFGVVITKHDGDTLAPIWAAQVRLPSADYNVGLQPAFAANDAGDVVVTLRPTTQSTTTPDQSGTGVDSSGGTSSVTIGFSDGMGFTLPPTNLRRQTLVCFDRDGALKWTSEVKIDAQVTAARGFDVTSISVDEDGDFVCHCVIAYPNDFGAGGSAPLTVNAGAVATITIAAQGNTFLQIKIDRSTGAYVAGSFVLHRVAFDLGASAYPGNPPLLLPLRSASRHVGRYVSTIGIWRVNDTSFGASDFTVTFNEGTAQQFTVSTTSDLEPGSNQTLWEMATIFDSQTMRIVAAVFSQAQSRAAGDDTVWRQQFPLTVGGFYVPPPAVLSDQTLLAPGRFDTSSSSAGRRIRRYSATGTLTTDLTFPAASPLWPTDEPVSYPIVIKAPPSSGPVYLQPGAGSVLVAGETVAANAPISLTKDEQIVQAFFGQVTVTTSLLRYNASLPTQTDAPFSNQALTLMTRRTSDDVVTVSRSIGGADVAPTTSLGATCQAVYGPGANDVGERLLLGWYKPSSTGTNDYGGGFASDDQGPGIWAFDPDDLSTHGYRQIFDAAVAQPLRFGLGSGTYAGVGLIDIVRRRA
jgi:hypothetical protein